jgi:purine nucleosidase
MRLWIDTDVGDNPDDTIGLWCAAGWRDAQLIGVSTVDGDVERRAAFAKTLLPETTVHAGLPPAGALDQIDVLVALGPWTNVAALADSNALPRRVVLMGGALGKVKHRGEWCTKEHNVSSDPAAAARLLAAVGSMIVVPLDSTARVHATKREERELVEKIPHLGDQIDAWRERTGDFPLALHDPATVLVALGEKIGRLESRRLTVDADGTMRASIDGPVQEVVAHIDAGATRARVRALASRG